MFCHLFEDWTDLGMTPIRRKFASLDRTLKNNLYNERNFFTQYLKQGWLESIRASSFAGFQILQKLKYAIHIDTKVLHNWSRLQYPWGQGPRAVRSLTEMDRNGPDYRNGHLYVSLSTFYLFLGQIGLEYT